MEKTKGSNKRILLIIICCALVLVMVRIIPMIVNPMRRPESMATNYVLRLTPIGMDMEEVISILENHINWRIRWISYERGFSRPHGK